MNTDSYLQHLLDNIKFGPFKDADMIVRTLEDRGYRVRILEKDGVSIGAVTLEYRDDRVNLKILNNLVTDIRIG